MRYKVTRTRAQRQHQLIEASSAAEALRGAELDSNKFSCSLPLGSDEWDYTVERVGA